MQGTRVLLVVPQVGHCLLSVAETITVMKHHPTPHLSQETCILVFKTHNMRIITKYSHVHTHTSGDGVQSIQYNLSSNVLMVLHQAAQCQL